MPTIAREVRQAIAEGRDDSVVLDLIARRFPTCANPRHTISYYRSEARRGSASERGSDAPSPSPRRTPRPTPRPTVEPERAFDAAALSDRAFGLEFEFIGGGRELHYYRGVVRRALAPWPEQLVSDRGGYYHSNGQTWDLKTDSTCDYELCTPRLTRADWPKVVAVLEALRAAGATVDNRCGFHVHHETRVTARAQALHREGPGDHAHRPRG